MAVAQCIHNGALQTQNVRIIVATLGNREPSFRQPFSSTTLMEQVALMPNIREAYIRTHSQHRDVDLAAMLAVMDKLETLSLTYVKPSFARYIDSDAEDEYDSEEDDLLGDSLYEYDEWDEPFKDEADGTLLLQETLPELPRLKHLFFKNFSFREAEMVMDDCRLYNLVSLSLDRILIIEAMLSWLISPFCR